MNTQLQKSDIGVIGLAVMGQNLARNMLRNGYRVSGYNRDEAKVVLFKNVVATDGAEVSERMYATSDFAAFVGSLATPRKIVMMVKAGAPVDDVLAQLAPHVAPGDIVIDGGNEDFRITERRVREAGEKGIRYIGTGVSGGEEGALNGPSIMPSGDASAWPEVREMFEKIAAKADDGSPCVAWIGTGGSGHFVKMVHNAIEYGDMQMIAEVYAIMRDVLSLSADECADIFASWNAGELESYLIDITAIVLKKKDEDGAPLVDKILDSAQQKGTGKWASQIALDLGVAAPTIAESVFARCLSSMKGERTTAATERASGAPAWQGSAAERQAVIAQLQQALFASKVCSYAQGFALLTAADTEYGWQLQYKEIANIWRAGCIIRAQFLDTIAKVYAGKSPQNLMCADYFKNKLHDYDAAWRAVVQLGVRHRVAMPTLTSALAYYDGYHTARLPANLTQAQRDFFGAHTYQRVDKEGVFHTEWAGQRMSLAGKVALR